MSRTGSIYALTDGEGVPYYVGKTVQSPGARLGEHRREATRRGRTSPCHERTAALVAAGEGPRVWVLESGVRIGSLSRAETYWSGIMVGAGFELLNCTRGGNGAQTMDPKARARQAALAAVRSRDEFARFLPLGAPDRRPVTLQVAADEYPF
jgi:hypothetical protein